MTGALAGLKVVELAGLGPAPFAAMLLADMGADVVRVDRPGPADPHAATNVMVRGRRSVVLDLKDPLAVEAVLRLAEDADVFIEGFRPGVAERLGIGPDPCHERNPRLVYGRMTGWGQEGPWASMAGHDINYIALAGVLHGIGRPPSPPNPPMNYVGDFGGGGAFLVIGILAALHERVTSGRGQVIDAAMVDGAALLGAVQYGLLTSGRWSTVRGTNFLDGSAPYYDTYECSDGRFVSIGSMEPQFFALLKELLKLEGDLWAQQHDRSKWPEQKAALIRMFRTRSRDEWTALLDQTDVCFAPVLDPIEAALHPHNAARGNIVDHHGVLQPAPAPRLSRTPSVLSAPPPAAGAHSAAVLGDLGFDAEDLERLLAASAS